MRIKEEKGKENEGQKVVKKIKAKVEQQGKIRGSERRPGKKIGMMKEK